jgi:hypothetical protein
VEWSGELPWLAKLEAIGWMATFQHPAEGWGTGERQSFPLRPFFLLSVQRERESVVVGELLCFGEASKGNTG